MEALVEFAGQTWLLSDVNVARQVANLLRLRRPGTEVAIGTYGPANKESWLKARILHLKRVQHARLDLEPDEDTPEPTSLAWYEQFTVMREEGMSNKEIATTAHRGPRNEKITTNADATSGRYTRAFSMIFLS